MAFRVEREGYKNTEKINRINIGCCVRMHCYNADWHFRKIKHLPTQSCPQQEYILLWWWKPIHFCIAMMQPILLLQVAKENLPHCDKSKTFFKTNQSCGQSYFEFISLRVNLNLAGFKLCLLLGSSVCMVWSNLALRAYANTIIARGQQLLRLSWRQNSNLCSVALPKKCRHEFAFICQPSTKWNANKHLYKSHMQICWNIVVTLKGISC